MVLGLRTGKRDKGNPERETQEGLLERAAKEGRRALSDGDELEALQSANRKAGWVGTSYVQDLTDLNGKVLVETVTGEGAGAGAWGGIRIGSGVGRPDITKPEVTKPEVTTYTYGLERLMAQTELEDGLRKTAYVYDGRTSVAQQVSWVERPTVEDS